MTDQAAGQPAGQAAGQAAGQPTTTRGGRASLVRPLTAVGLVLGAGVIWGVLWWWLAPTARTVVQDGGVYLQGHDELMIGQDGWFVVLGAVTGAVLATLWPALTRARPIAGLFTGLAGCLAAGLVAWGLGVWLGPDALTSQLARDVKAPVTPIALHTPAALLFAPFLFVIVRGLMELLGSAVAGMHTEPPPPGHLDVDRDLVLARVRRVSSAGHPHPAGAVTARRP